MRDLAPGIYRQRLVIEGECPQSIGAEAISSYLTALSSEIGMTALIEPVTHCSAQYGWAGWIHWETSGAHFYAWDTPQLFFSVDIYSCKPFDIEHAVAFTAATFGATSIEHASL